MQMLELIENKMPTTEHLEYFEKKLHNHITKFGLK